MDHETKKELARLEARIKQLEMKLAISSMPAEAVSLLEELEMVPEIKKEEIQLSLEMIDDFLVLLGYKTWICPELSAIDFTDGFRDFNLVLHSNLSIDLRKYYTIEPEVDLTILSKLITTQDFGISIDQDSNKGMLTFKVSSTPLNEDSYRESIRFFICLLNDAEASLFSNYTSAYRVKNDRTERVRYS